MLKFLPLFLLIALLVFAIPARAADSSTVFATDSTTPQTVDKTTDSDGDGLSDYNEINFYHTDPNKADTDGDGYSDGNEVTHGYDPLNPAPDARETDKHVVVNLNTQQLDYYFENVKIGTMPVSTGIRGMETPTGAFSIFKKVPVKEYKGLGYDLPNTKWNLEFLPGFYLHGAYWHHEFGIKPMSHGCVNIATSNAAVLYQFMDIGNAVMVTGTTPTRALAKK